MAGHAKTDEQVLLVSEVGLDVVLISVYGIGVIFRPSIDLFVNTLENDVEFILHLFNLRGSRNAGFDKGRSTGDRQ